MPRLPQGLPVGDADLQRRYDSSAAPAALTVWSLLLDCPPESLPWSALGYQAGRADGRAEVYAEVADAGRVVARAARPILRWPTHAELQRRRGEAS